LFFGTRSTTTASKTGFTQPPFPQQTPYPESAVDKTEEQVDNHYQSYLVTYDYSRPVGQIGEERGPKRG
jgi:hypothetical protein